ncbi:FAD-dependent monooxygenase [Nocardia noduli]|uniref:FAD-dependent monooxygenase n=1 Tax=Nocardia noduli TaxID=2815722 RepID=UPI001C226A69|nr:FAD-dependent monooxygenase [Nocardia noduli]
MHPLSVRSVLVIGGGLAGSAAAIFLARAGVRVDLIETNGRGHTVGSGITLQGNALRVLRDLGVWERAAARSGGFDTIGIRATDEAGTLLAEIPDNRTGGPDLPAAVGMQRPVLTAILHDAAETAGANLRFETQVDSLVDGADEVEVTFGDGSRTRYDVVIGADGLRSATRRALGFDSEPRPVAADRSRRDQLHLVRTARDRRAVEPGRVVLIGDAAHVCPPTLAQGGAQALEDAAVLSELLTTEPVDEQLWQRFTERRLPRANAVVEASVQLGRWMLDHDPDADVPGLMGRIAALVTDPT